MIYKAIEQVKDNNIELLPDYNFTQKKYESEFEIFLTNPNITKVDILDFFELNALCYYCDIYRYGNKFECDELFWEIPDSKLDSKNPTYISEYINIIGQLFLAGYIDFLCDWDNSDIIDYPSNLSYYKEDKYEAWIYFRDNYFYTSAYNKEYDEDIMIYEGKEYSVQDCPRTINKEGDSVLCGYSTMYSPTSWDTPKYWSQYNILVARTEKGTKYFNEILAPRFYNKYKDLEVEIDSKGNVVRWIGEIGSSLAKS